MLLEDINNVDTYLYLKVLAVLSSRFKVGDYIKLFETSYNEDDEIVWEKGEDQISAFRSRLSEYENVYARFQPIYKITRLEDGYMTVEKIIPAELPCEHHIDDGTDLDPMGSQLRSEIDTYLDSVDFTEVQANKAIDFFTNNYIKLDEDYADSIIFESIYEPYSSAIDIKEMVDRVELARLKEHKELLRRRALRGHETRRRRKAGIDEKARKEAITASLAKLSKLLRATSKKKVVKKKVKAKKKVARRKSRRGTK